MSGTVLNIEKMRNKRDMIPTLIQLTVSKGRQKANK